MNILMQLRKVCNHPDLFEVRSIASPFVLPVISYHPGGRITLQVLEKDPVCNISNSLLCFWDCKFSNSCNNENIQLLTKDQFYYVEDINIKVKCSLDNNSKFNSLLKDIQRYLQVESNNKQDFNYNLNKSRCTKDCINLSQSLINAVTIMTPTVRYIYLIN
jgi:hypothetical protein